MSAMQGPAHRGSQVAFKRRVTPKLARRATTVGGGGESSVMALAVAPRTLAVSGARELGAYYTPDVAARYMARWALRPETGQVLEPSMGDGQFLRAIAAEAERSGHAPVALWGVELARDTYERTLAEGWLNPRHAINNDFLAVDPFEVDVVIGNPPYVRLRHLPLDHAARASEAAAEALGEAIDPAGSLWMPFVLHSIEFLREGGRMAFVLPYDFTYVRYARPLWQHLASRFSNLRVVRVHERVFPDILQDVVLFFADGYGGTTTTVDFEAYERRQDLDGGKPMRTASIPVQRIVAGERPFTEALLPAGLPELLATKIATGTVPARELVTFNIGYVAGDKAFFHPSDKTIEKYKLPDAALLPSLSSGRRAKGAGLFTTSRPASGVSRFYLPDPERLTDGERRYIAAGKRSGVANRYKCAIRDPWYVTPGVKIPDVVVPVFADRPQLFVNDAGLVASNSMLCGYLKGGSARSLAAAWYTSLTLLQVELNVHSLGGGVIVFVPQETGAVRLPKGVRVSKHLTAVDAALRAGDLDGAYEAGDEPVLHGVLGLTAKEVRLVEEGVASLRHWRTSRPRGE